MKRDPNEFFDPTRLDLVIKRRFFRHLIDGNDPQSEDLYRRHIFGRTKGREPRSWKASLDDYVMGCRDLLASMQAKGFDPEHPVVVGMNGRLMEGAHRIACAAALGLEVEVETKDRIGRAVDWDAEWLEKSGIRMDEIHA